MIQEVVELYLLKKEKEKTWQTQFQKTKKTCQAQKDTQKETHNTPTNTPQNNT